jgi:6-phosphofructokinase 1
VKIGVLTSGGDCPGLNAVIYGVTHAASQLGWEVVGIMDGYEGLFPPTQYRYLNPEITADIMHLGGTILGTTNRGKYLRHVDREKNHACVPDENIQMTKNVMKELGIEALVTIGGEGSLGASECLHENGIPVVGVPKTIDNDIAATAMTFGFDSAVACVVDGLDRLRTTAQSHKRAMIVEVMGRHAGWIALHGGFAGGANAILIPEIPFTYAKIFDFIRQREASGHHTTMIVVSEGAHEKDKGLVMKEVQGHKGESNLGGIGEQMSRAIAEQTGKETRHVVLGHLQRGGMPTALDRTLGARFGIAAVQLIKNKQFGQMVTYQNYCIGQISLKEATATIKTVPLDSQFLQQSRDAGIIFGD